MTFIRATSPTYFAPAAFNTLDSEGRLVEHKFDCQFKRHKKSELEQLDAEIKQWPSEKKDRNVLERVMVGWRAVQAPDGSALTFSLEAIDQTEEEFPGFMAACVRSFYLSTQPREAAHLAAAKN